MIVRRIALSAWRFLLRISTVLGVAAALCFGPMLFEMLVVGNSDPMMGAMIGMSLGGLALGIGGFGCILLLISDLIGESEKIEAMRVNEDMDSIEN